MTHRCLTCGKIVAKIKGTVKGWVDEPCHPGHRSATYEEIILWKEGYD